MKMLFKSPSQRHLSYTDENVLIVRHGPCKLLQEMLNTTGQGWRTFATFGLNVLIWRSDVSSYISWNV